MQLIKRGRVVVLQLQQPLQASEKGRDPQCRARWKSLFEN